MADDNFVISPEEAITFLAKQQISATAMVFGVMGVSEPDLRPAMVAAVRTLASAAEADKFGGDLRKMYADGLRAHADAIEAGEWERGKDPAASIFTVIDGGRKD